MAHWHSGWWGLALGVGAGSGGSRAGTQPGQPCGGGGVTQAVGSAAIMIIIGRQGPVRGTVWGQCDGHCVRGVNLYREVHDHDSELRPQYPESSAVGSGPMQLAVRVTVSACLAWPSETADWDCRGLLAAVRQKKRSNRCCWTVVVIKATANTCLSSFCFKTRKKVSLNYRLQQHHNG